MSSAPLERSATGGGEMRPAPINPDWIRSGMPLARCESLSRSRDDTAWTDVWDCTAGSFEWRYEIDETAHFLEGAATITDQDGVAWTVGPGDVFLFRAGTKAHWHVPHYVRKVAFCREALPWPIAALMKIQGKVRRRRRVAVFAAIAGFLAMAMPVAVLVVE